MPSARRTRQFDPEDGPLAGTKQPQVSPSRTGRPCSDCTSASLPLFHVREAVFMVFNVEFFPLSIPSSPRSGIRDILVDSFFPRPSHAPSAGVRLESRTSRTWGILSLVFRSLFVPLCPLWLKSLPQSHSLPAAGRSCPPGTLKELSRVV